VKGSVSISGLKDSQSYYLKDAAEAASPMTCMLMSNYFDPVRGRPLTWTNADTPIDGELSLCRGCLFMTSPIAKLLGCLGLPRIECVLDDDTMVQSELNDGG
jgi:hypothetical protein